MGRPVSRRPKSRGAKTSCRLTTRKRQGAPCARPRPPRARSRRRGGRRPRRAMKSTTSGAASAPRGDRRGAARPTRDDARDAGAARAVTQPFPALHVFATRGGLQSGTARGALEPGRKRWNGGAGPDALRPARPFPPFGAGRTCPLGLLGRRVVLGAARRLRRGRRRRGMDLVTLTDHDTIAGALEIAPLPGTFLSEEVSCLLPGGRRAPPRRLRHHRGAARGRSRAAATTRRPSSPTWPRSASRRRSTTCSRRSPAGARPPTSTARSPACRWSRPATA